MSRRLPLFTLRASVRTVLADAGAAGATLADIEAATGSTRPKVQRCLGALGEAGEKFSAPITSKLWRHFATEAQRDAWVAGGARKCAMSRHACQMDKPKMGAKVPHIPKPTEHQKPPTYTAGSSKTAPRSSGEVRGMDTAPRIVAKTPAGRFDPDPGYVGPFSLAGIGRDVQTGKAWAPSMGAGSVFAWRPAA